MSYGLLRSWRAQWDLRAALSSSGWTALFLAVTATVERAQETHFELHSFAGRIVSLPTELGIDIGARSALFVSSVLLFLFVFFGGLVVLQSASRSLPVVRDGLLEGLSIAGLALWMALAYTVDTSALIQLVVALEIAVVMIGMFDRWLFRAGEHPERVAYFGSLGLLAFGLLTTGLDWFQQELPGETPWLNWYLAALVVGLHVLVRAVCSRGDPDRRQRAIVCLMAGLTPAAWLPLVSLLRAEIYVSLNNHGVMRVHPGHVQVALLFGLTIWGAIRLVRCARAGAPAGLERSLLGAGLPIFAFGLAACADYYAVCVTPTDLFEPANAGLHVQQLFDFGRLPWIETFNAHGFSDSLWSILFCFIQGFHYRTFHFYSFLSSALGTVLIYSALRRATGSGYLAFFCAVLFPFRPAIFPPYCVLSLASVFVLEWLIARPNVWRWTSFGFYCVAVFLWRLDMGLANLLASAATLVAVLYLLEGSVRPRPRDMVRAFVLCFAACGGTYLTLALWRGVDPWQRLLDLRHIVDSAQATGYAHIADTWDPNVFWHLAVFPVGVLALLGWLLWSGRRGRDGLRSSFLVLMLLYCGAYYFGNYQRGLVRHTFSEPGNVYLLSLGFAALALSPYAWARSTSPRIAAAVFLGSSCLLAGSFGLMGPLPQSSAKFTGPWQDAAERRTSKPPITYSRERIERSPMPAETGVHHYDAMREFTQRMLAPEQTFLDLSNSPVLYMDTHRVSPQYVNQIMLVHDEWLQRRQLEDISRHDIPFALVWQENDLAALDGVRADSFNQTDDVANNVRHYLFFEWLHARYEPWCIVHRWQIWRRKDWLAPAGPAAEGARELASHHGPVPPGGRIALPLQSTDAAVDSQPSSEHQICVRIGGRNARSGELAVRVVPVGIGVSAAAVERKLLLPAGSGPWFWTLPVCLHGKRVTAVDLDLERAPDLVLDEVVVLESDAPEYTMMAGRLYPQSSHGLGHLPWLWANEDPRHALAQPTLRTVYVEGSEHLQPLQIQPRTDEYYERGVHRHRALFVLDGVDRTKVLNVGDHVRFASAGMRTVLAIEDGRVTVSGARLDPVADGMPHPVLRMPPGIPELAPSMRMKFEPLEDPTRPCYVALRLRGERSRGTYAAIRWGQDERTLGTFHFEVLGEGPQDYLMRISAQSSWALERCNWIEFVRHDSGAELISVRLLEGD